jgi:ABC-type lipoprotein release transport system permease subunit
MALGAPGARILRMVIRQGAVQIAIGLTLGLGAALLIAIAAADGIQNVLFGVSARDPMTYAAVATLITAVSLIASWVPALRATRVDPMVALRAD